MATGAQLVCIVCQNLFSNLPYIHSKGKPKHGETTETGRQVTERRRGERLSVELEDVLDVLLGSEENGDTLVDASGDNVEDALASGNEKHRISVHSRRKDGRDDSPAQ
jgi:hypothetical protein